MTAQEMFDKVWDHFIVKKNKPGVNIGGCIYRGKDDDGVEVCCAVGCLLPPTDQAPWVTKIGGAVYDILNNREYGKQVAEALFGEPMDIWNAANDPRFAILRQMQQQHDDAGVDFNVKEITLEQFRKRFAEGLWTIAKADKLTIPAVGGTFDENGVFTEAA